MRHIQRAAVLGAGTMGAQIAAHLANAGVPVQLLDVSAEAARDGMRRAAVLRPDPFFTRDGAALVTTAGFDEGIPGLGGTDWIVEAIVERLDIKRQLFERIDQVRANGAIVTSNTSGIPIKALAEGRSQGFRTHFAGTHFFNPPRYLHLLEIIPTTDTDPAIVEFLGRFADERLGKGVVEARDTPNFIANRIGLFGVVRTLEVLEAGQYTIEEIDAITGPAIGRPKSATFRTMDIAGIDVLAHVAANLAERLTDERALFMLPPLIGGMIERGWAGAKSGQGFYRKAGDDILTLDPGSMEYRAKQPARLQSIDASRSIESAAERMRALFLGSDRVGAFLRATLAPLLVYTARVTPAIAHSIDDVDRAMRWGFGWDLGPFEIWDAIGPRHVVEACPGATLPPLAKEALDRGAFRLCRAGDARGAMSTPVEVPPSGPAFEILRAARERSAVMRRNAAASLVDLGDGVVAVEFHSKMNAIGADTIQMVNAGVKEATANHRALVVGNEAANFSAGANLMLLLLEAQEENWDDLELIMRQFQQMVMSLKYAAVPVIVAPRGLTLGGGCEIALHADRVQASAETYMGLSEVGVGLIPAGGGTTEMLVRAMDAAAVGADSLPPVQRVFETIGFARISTSAADARQIGYLRDVDAVTMNRDRLIADAKARALSRTAEYVPGRPRENVPVGGESVLAALKLGVHLAWRAGRISDHDALIGRKLARILAGGDLPHAATVSEQHLLDLEREAFLGLCGERRTQDRIAHTLKTGKPLRN